MVYHVRQSTAIAAFPLGPFLDDTDGKTAETALTLTQPDIRLSKNGGTFAQKSAAQTLTHMENGYYGLALSATDTDTVGMLRVHCHEAGALPVWVDLEVIEEAIYDALYAASATGLLPSNVTQFGGSALTQTGGRPEVNTSHAAGTAWGSGAITAASIATDAITAGKLAVGAIGAAELATDAVTEIVDAVWVAAARTLTANTNFNDLDAAAMRTAVGLAAANLDTQIGDLPTNAELATSQAAADDATLAAIAALNDITVADILATAFEGAATVQDFFRLASAALFGKSSGAATTTITFEGRDGTTDRIVATVDADGNRTAVVVTP